MQGTQFSLGDGDRFPGFELQIISGGLVDVLDVGQVHDKGMVGSKKKFGVQVFLKFPQVPTRHFGGATAQQESCVPAFRLEIDNVLFFDELDLVHGGEGQNLDVPLPVFLHG